MASSRQPTYMPGLRQRLQKASLSFQSCSTDRLHDPHCTEELGRGSNSGRVAPARLLSVACRRVGGWWAAGAEPGCRSRRACRCRALGCSSSKGKVTYLRGSWCSWERLRDPFRPVEDVRCSVLFPPAFHHHDQQTAGLTHIRTCRGRARQPPHSACTSQMSLHSQRQLA